MLVEDEEVQYKKNCFLLFWKNPRTYLTPPEPPGHIYIPLKNSIISCRIKPIISYFPQIQNLIDEKTFSDIYSASMDAISSNWISICFLPSSYAALILFSIISAILLSHRNFFYGIIFTLVDIAAILLIRICNSLRQVGMKKKELRLRKVLDEKANILEGSGFMVSAGKLGLWLDFYRSEYYLAAENYDPAFS